MSEPNLIHATPDEERVMGAAADHLFEVCAKHSRAIPHPDTPLEDVAIATRSEHTFLATLALVQASTNRAKSLREVAQYLLSMAQAIGHGIGNQIDEEAIMFLMGAVSQGLQEGVNEARDLAIQTVSH